MGAFNEILDIELECPFCTSRSRSSVQFKYAMCWQFSYTIGDSLKWGNKKNPRAGIGDPDFRHVIAEGVVTCTSCKQMFCCDIHIVHNVLSQVDNPHRESRGFGETGYILQV